MDAKIIRHLKPPQFDIDQLVTLGGKAFTFRANIVNGDIRVEFGDDLSVIKRRIGRMARPGKPALRKD